MNRTEEEKNGGNEKRLRQVCRNVSGSLTSGRPLSACKPINLYLRTSFSHSASVEKTAANQARGYGIGMQQRAAMRFVGGSLCPLSQQSAVSMLRCWAAEVHHQNVTARFTQGEATSACLPDRHCECYKSEGGCADKQKSGAVRRDSGRKTRHPVPQ